MSSKIDHKELQRRLKEDEVQVYIQELVENGRTFLDTYGAKIGFGLLVVLILSIGTYVWQSRQQSNFTLAQTYFANALTLIQFEQPQYEQAISELTRLIQEFPDARVTPLAFLQRANAHFNTGNLEQALTDYQTAAAQLPVREKIAATMGIIQTHRSLGNAQAALDTIASLEPTLQSDAMKNKILFLKGGVYQDMGDDANALSTYRSIDPDSSWYSFAQDQIRWLEASAVSSVN